MYFGFQYGNPVADSGNANLNNALVPPYLIWVMSIFNKPNTRRPKQTALRFFCALIYAFMLAASLSLHGDLEYVEETIYPDVNTHNIERFKNKANHAPIDEAFEENTTDDYPLTAYLKPSSDFSYNKEYFSSLEAYFYRCFQLLPINKTRLLSYLHYQSEHSLLD